MPEIDPHDLDPTDPRPIYDQYVLPGGPWHRYHPTTWVDAYLIKGPWLQRRASDGMLVERQGDMWVTISSIDGSIAVYSQSEFADLFDIID